MQHYSGDGVDDDKETLLTFKADELLANAGDGGEDDWVATHTGAKRKHDSVWSYAIQLIPLPVSSSRQCCERYRYPGCTGHTPLDICGC